MEMSTATAPATPQHLRALRRANEVRLAGAELRREVRAGKLTVTEALEDPRAAGLPLQRLLTSGHRIGARKAARIIQQAEMTVGLRIRSDRRVGDLNLRCRRALREALNGR